MHPVKQPVSRPPWFVVRRWPIPSPGRRGLRPEAKIIWSYLFDIAGGVERSVVTHAAHAGAACGMSERACRRALDSLAEWSLIDIPDRYNGEITIYLNDPQKVAAARLLPGESNGQRELEFPDTPQSPSEAVPSTQAGVIPLPLGAVGADPPSADLASNPPADMAPNPPSPNIEHDPRARIKTLNINIPSENVVSSKRRQVGGFDARSAAKSADSRDWERVQREALASRSRQVSDDPLSFAAAIGAQSKPVEDALLTMVSERVARVDIPGQEAKARETAEWIRRHLDPIDPQYLDWVKGRCLALAWVLVEGRWPPAELSKLLAQMKESERLGKLNTTRAQWFIGTVSRVLHNKGIAFRKAQTP